MSFINFWTENTLPIFKLLNILNSKNTIITSCFNKELLNIEKYKNKTLLYYSGEKYTFEENADIILSFIPNTLNNNKYENMPIYSVNLTKSKYQYYMNKKIIPIKLVLGSNKEIIQLRDHERFYIEKKCNDENINVLDKSNIKNIDIYTKLESIRLRNYNLFKNNKDNIFKYKPKFCCFIVSNPRFNPRNKLFTILKIIMNLNNNTNLDNINFNDNNNYHIHSLGKFMKNVDIIIPDRENQTDAYINLISQYQFMIAAENIFLPWYHTEKIYNCFLAGTVPIYLGDPLISNIYNTNNFINIDTSTIFNNIKENDNFDLFDECKNNSIDRLIINNMIEACYKVKNICKNLDSEYYKFFENSLLINKNQDQLLQNNILKLYNKFNK